MRFSVAVSAAALVAGAAASTNGTAGIVYVTDVVSYYTTYCPEATSVTVNPSKTYIVTEATTLTITDCPCTITRPATSSVAAVMTSLTASSSSVSSSAVVAPVSSAASSSLVAPVSASSVSSSVVAPVAASSTSAAVAPIYSNGTVATTVAPVGTASSGLPTSASSSAPLTHYTGAASKFSASGAGLAAVFGLAVYAL